MILDGRHIAEDIYRELEARRTRIAEPVTLGIVVGSHDPVIESFVRIKSKAAARLNVLLRRIDLLAQPSTADVLAAIEQLAPEVQGLIVQLPLPPEIVVGQVLTAIPPYLDVDGISPGAVATPPVALAVAELLQRGGVSPEGKHAVVVGSGRLVGAPAAQLLMKLGASVRVLEKGDSLDALKDADIVVLGAGEPGIVRPEHLKEGVALIDAGTSEIGGKIAGDADPSCAEKAAIYTPVPGGVGPVAVAMIFKNLLDFVEKK